MASEPAATACKVVRGSQVHLVGGGAGWGVPLNRQAGAAFPWISFAHLAVQEDGKQSLLRGHLPGTPAQVGTSRIQISPSFAGTLVTCKRTGFDVAHAEMEAYLLAITALLLLVQASLPSSCTASRAVPAVQDMRDLQGRLGLAMHTPHMLSQLPCDAFRHAFLGNYEQFK